MDEEIKIVIEGNKIMTLKELFEGEEKARKEIARLPFEEKIRMLVELQRLAKTWGNKKDIIVWKL